MVPYMDYQHDFKVTVTRLLRRSKKNRWKKRRGCKR